MKILNFKTISPFFEQERDGIKPFTVRQWDAEDDRFIGLVTQNKPCDVVQITNPETGESFCRKYERFTPLRIPLKVMTDNVQVFIIIWLGKSETL